MLVLSRKQNECIVIGETDEVVVTVLKVRGDKVRLGITAPRDVKIDRLEVRLSRKPRARRRRESFSSTRKSKAGLTSRSTERIES